MNTHTEVNNRLYESNYNYQKCLMKIIKYNRYNDIVVEFQDKHKTKVNSKYSHFLSGNIKNPYYPDVCNVGISGNVYPLKCKEYRAWKNILVRCYDTKIKKKHPTYQNAICCDEWLYYDNFYEWIHSQENFKKWITLPRSAVDKDILIKGNKIYSPETCCLVPSYINNLFIKANNTRGELPIGVFYVKKREKYSTSCQGKFLGYYDTVNEAYTIYKQYKENIVQQIAKEEFKKGNITQHCYKSMMNYEVEITD